MNICSVPLSSLELIVNCPAGKLRWKKKSNTCPRRDPRTSQLFMKPEPFVQRGIHRNVPVAQRLYVQVALGSNCTSSGDEQVACLFPSDQTPTLAPSVFRAAPRTCSSEA